MSEDTSEFSFPLLDHRPFTIHVLGSNGPELTCRYAANAIVLPQMDMYSNLLSTDATAMLDHLTTSHSKTDKSQFNNHWRGRYGHTEEGQAKIWASINPDPETVGGGLGTSSDVTATVPLRFKTFEGEIRVVDAKIGDTLLQVARQWDLPSMEGSCGGNLGMSIPPHSQVARLLQIVLLVSHRIFIELSTS